MAKKDKVIISKTDDFAEVEAELASALELLDDANTRVETLLQEHKKTEPEETGATLFPESIDQANAHL
jgi:hypothetical protein